MLNYGVFTWSAKVPGFTLGELLLDTDVRNIHCFQIPFENPYFYYYPIYPGWALGNWSFESLKEIDRKQNL